MAQPAIGRLALIHQTLGKAPSGGIKHETSALFRKKDFKTAENDAKALDSDIEREFKALKHKAETGINNLRKRHQTAEWDDFTKHIAKLQNANEEICKKTLEDYLHKHKRTAFKSRNGPFAGMMHGEAAIPDAVDALPAEAWGNIIAAFTADEISYLLETQMEHLSDIFEIYYADIISRADEDGSTALHYSTHFERLNAIKWLLDWGANPMARDDTNYTALLYIFSEYIPIPMDNQIAMLQLFVRPAIAPSVDWNVVLVECLLSHSVLEMFQFVYHMTNPHPTIVSFSGVQDRLLLFLVYFFESRTTRGPICQWLLAQPDTNLTAQDGKGRTFLDYLHAGHDQDGIDDVQAAIDAQQH